MINACPIQHAGCRAVPPPQSHYLELAVGCPRPSPGMGERRGRDEHKVDLFISLLFWAKVNFTSNKLSYSHPV